ncbi:HpcH/HpaI aldolase/citrate lyase family protein [Fulvimonas soli]|uniref:Citrate lyase subunit beta/citryl-CoA lyase n=1 Tax=Fulvimonas soli TaxID=155197 RepID=A0A316IGL1_9GAMM|nr:aldolase/citrate lyase family protein [Fulvimonas soli]PWK92451.1 citrate lyase subunit beta/citryl-CoA lyase [Fulvimonas soli]TNY26252.1 CoA ester lyase [Fulvimonas soli]
MRSKLFVPGARPELFAKALAGPADALSFDLEDAVAAGRKDEARAQVAAFVGSAAVRAAAKVVIVRVNAPGTPYFEDDLRAVACPGVALLNLPKLESAAALRAAAAAVERAERANGVAAPIRLLVNIETPLALARAAALAGAHPRVAGLQLGLGDLFEPQGIDRRDAASVHAAMFAVRMAAAQADVFALDGAFADLADDAGFAAEARMARRLGYLGKSCIHPRQVALANAAFAPSEAELAAARRIVAAAAEAERAGRGAFVVDGRMIDLPFLKRAQAIVAAAG